MLRTFAHAHREKEAIEAAQRNGGTGTFAVAIEPSASVRSWQAQSCASTSFADGTRTLILTLTVERGTVGLKAEGDFK